MTETIIDLTRPQWRRIERQLKETDDADVHRRTLAIKFLSECRFVTEVARRLEASRTSVYKWKDWYEQADVDGLQPKRQGPPKTTVDEELIAKLRGLMATRPESFGYVSSRWTSGLLAKVLEDEHGIEIHASTVRRLLKDLGYRWRRARPASSSRRDPNKEEKLQAIEKALERTDDPGVEVVYVDEAKLELNPRIGFGWREVGKQTRVVTPGTNPSAMVSGAMHASTGALTWMFGETNTTDLFLELLDRLEREYANADEIVVILDNAPSHTSKRTQERFEASDRLQAVYQPTYTPEANEVEKLWRQLHHVVTRHHQHQNLEALKEATDRFLSSADPFPSRGEARFAKGA